jgi:hypothetical protein
MFFHIVARLGRILPLLLVFSSSFAEDGSFLPDRSISAGPDLFGVGIFPDPDLEAPPSLPAVTVVSEEGRIRLAAQGFAWDEVKKISWKGRRFSKALDRAFEKERAWIEPTPVGFDLVIADPGILFHLQGEGVLSLTLRNGLLVPVYAAVDTSKRGPKPAGIRTAEETPCPWLTFSPPTKTAANQSCLYGSKTCAKPGYYHTGIDFGYSSDTPYVYAVADGKVVWVEKMNSKDHGMGSNVIVEHVVSSCSNVYSSYSHLDSIDSKIKVGALVARGKKIGKMGGSGYGNPAHWPTHLHGEIKKKAVTSTPWAYKDTCPSGCWGYVKYHPDNYGYSDLYGWVTPPTPP